MENRSGIFVGTREFAVPSRNHLAALVAVKRLSDVTKEPVTVFNFDRRRGAKLISEMGFRKIRVHEKRMSYRAYLGEVARHKIIFQLDRSRVPGQVAGDALLCRTACVGGDGAIERIAFPQSCGAGRTIDEIASVALELLSNVNSRAALVAESQRRALERISFQGARKQLSIFFARIGT